MSPISVNKLTFIRAVKNFLLIVVNLIADGVKVDLEASCVTFLMLSR